jgi:O-acetylserine/cysteine efflux transporter
MSLFHFFLALLVVSIWGFNFIAIRVGLGDIPPLFLAFLRFFFTAIPFVFFMKRPSVSWKFVLAYATFMFALQFAFLFLGMHAGVSPGLASLLAQSHVFFSIFLAALFLEERLHPWQIIGALTAFSGIGLVAYHVHAGVTGVGVLFVLMGAASWGAGNLFTKKMGHVEILPLVVWASLIASPLLLIVSFFVEGRDAIVYALQNLTWLSAAAIAYIAYAATLFCFCGWSWLLHHHSIGKVAPFTLLVPVVALFSSAWIFGEPLQEWKLLAALLVITGLCINLLGLHKKVRE